MTPVAEGFDFGLAAAAEGDGRFFGGNLELVSRARDNGYHLLVFVPAIFKPPEF